MLEEYYKATDAGTVSGVYALEAGLIGAEVPLFAYRFSRVFDAAMLESDAAKRTEILNSFKPQADEFYRDFDLALEKDVFVQLVNLYRKNIPADQRPSWMAEIDKKYKGNVQAFADRMYSTTMFRSKETLMAFLDKPSQKAWDKDMAGMVARSSIETYRLSMANPAQEKFDVGYRLYVAGLREMNPNKS
ncbi:MAG: S46 family peptidase, partial [Phycisphaerae bacterium]